MRKVTAFFILCALLTGVASAGAAPAGSQLGLGFGVSPHAGILFAGAPDLGWSGVSMEAVLTWSEGMLHLEAGLEAGQSPIGWQVLAPVRAGARLVLPPFTLEALAEAAPGVALFRQAPLFMIGVGALGRGVWNPGPHFGVFVTLGARWTTSPAYAGYAGIAYSTLDVLIAIGARLGL